MDDLTDEQIIEHSKANPDQVFTDDKGRVAFGGTIYRTKEEFEMSIGLFYKLLNWRKRIRKFFGLKT